MTAGTQVSTCLVCGSVENISQAPEDALRQCRECTFTWTANELAVAEELYDESYFTGGGYEDYFQPQARRFEAGLRLRWLLARGAPTTLVEAGCAAGFFVEAAANVGITAHGVEISAEIAKYACDELGLSVRHASFETAEFGTTFDAVCAFHVLEHVADPREFIDAVWRTLEPGGLLALEVPNIASVAARRLGADWGGLQLEYHRWHFTPQSLVRLVTERGFEIIDQDTAVFRFYMPPRFRRRQGRHLIRADVRNLRSLRLTHPWRADLLRLIARRPIQATP